jgi:hypothetical protein
LISRSYCDSNIRINRSLERQTNSDHYFENIIPTVLIHALCDANRHRITVSRFINKKEYNIEEIVIKIIQH